MARWLRRLLGRLRYRRRWAGAAAAAALAADTATAALDRRLGRPPGLRRRPGVAAPDAGRAGS